MTVRKNNKDQLAAYFTQAVKSLLGEGQACPAVEIDRPRMPEHGDYACNLAMQIAKPLKSNPRAVATQLVEKVQALDGGKLITAMEIAGPGFINIRVTNASKFEVVHAIHEQLNCFGTNSRGVKDGVAQKVMVEFVSANPTGPLHVGHGRQGALGDAMASLLQANGFDVTREFYYNDAGAQINNLALSVQARLRGIGPEDEAFPENGYKGEYIADIAREFPVRPKTHSVSGDESQDINAIREFAVAYLRNEQDKDLQAFGVKFDNYYLESSLYSDGRVDKTVAALVAAGKTFEDGGALWLRTTEYGDDKDRVMRKSSPDGEGGYTYFVPDVAYHLSKYERGFHKAINVQGSDHHGTIARVRAGLQAVGAGIPKGFPDYVLHKMVTVMKGGEEVKISKRAGSYVTLRDLIEWSGGANSESDAARQDTAHAELAGRDAVRFFLLSRKADTEFIFDVDLALAKSDENPAYYIQYAHARICSVIAQAVAQAGVNEASLSTADLSVLTAPREFALAARLADYPEIVISACDDLAPHAIAFYLKDLSADLHSYYNAERFLVDDEKLRAARLSLLVATRQVMRNGLALIGVSAPVKM
jgi:arginyl-tRNA synthetase